MPRHVRISVNIIARKGKFVNFFPDMRVNAGPIPNDLTKKFFLFIFFEKSIDKRLGMCYNSKVTRTRPVGQAVKTLASHAGNMGSIPVRVTRNRKRHCSAVPFPISDEFVKRI